MLEFEKLDAALLDRARRIEFVLLDVDGVLTDGRIHIPSDADEGRSFYVRDGLGIRMGQQAGLSFGLLSGRASDVVTRRASELGIAEIHQGVLDKKSRFEEILKRLDLTAESACFVGDDLIDLPAMRLAGFTAAPADADAYVRSSADYVTRRDGGRGAVREVIDLLLHASGRWDGVMARFTRD